MVHQTLRNERTSGNGAHGDAPAINPARGAARSSSRLAYNLMALLGLQGRLFVADLRSSQRSLKLSGLLVIIGAVAFLASLPIILIGTALALRYWGVPDVGACFMAAGLGLTIAAASLVLAWKFLRRSLQVFGRSTSELRRNLDCFKEMCRPEE